VLFGDLLESRPDLLFRSSQCIADHTATLVNDGRGTELMKIVHSDPLMKMLKILTELENSLAPTGRPSAISAARAGVVEIVTLRSRRLSAEAQNLPPTHFLILGALCFLLLGSYCLVALDGTTTIDGVLAVSAESRVSFAVLAFIFILFFNFSTDLNEPFEGVYQIKRSQTAACLLSAKKTVESRDPDGEVDWGFDENGERR